MLLNKELITTATDVVASIPDELTVSPHELNAIATVLRLLVTILHQRAAH